MFFLDVNKNIFKIPIKLQYIFTLNWQKFPIIQVKKYSIFISIYSLNNQLIKAIFWLTKILRYQSFSSDYYSLRLQQLTPKTHIYSFHAKFGWHFSSWYGFASPLYFLRLRLSPNLPCFPHYQVGFGPIFVRPVFLPHLYPFYAL